MKRMLSILALLGAFLLMPFVAQAQVEQYTITINQVEHATIEVTAGGSMFGARPVKSGDKLSKSTMINIKVTADEGYQATHYIVNETEKPIKSSFGEREPVLEDMVISAKVVEVAQCKVTIVDPEHGKLSVTNTKTYKLINSGDNVDSSTGVNIRLTPDANYEIEKWLINDQEITPEAGRNNLFYTVEGDVTISARLKSNAPEPTKYTVTLGDLPAEQGTFTATYGADNTAVQSGAELPEGTKITFTATAAEGYEFDYWMVNDVKSDDMSNPLVITLAAALKVVPVMKQKAAPQPTTYKVTLGNIPAEQGYYYATYDGLNEIKNGKSKALPAGTKVTFQIDIPNGDDFLPKYNVTSWSVNGNLVEVKEPKYEISLTEDVTVFPVLEKNGTEPDPGTDPTPKGKVSLVQPKDEQGNTCGGKLSACYYDDDFNEIEVNDGDEVPAGTSVSFKVELADGYEMAYWKFNGEIEELYPDDDEPFNNAHEVSADEVLKVEPIVKKKGAAAVEYTITMVQPQEGQGTLTAHVGDKTYKGEFKATAGTEIFFSVEPAADYEMYYWLINDQRVDPSAGNPNQLTRKVEGNLKVEPILMSKDAPEPTTYTVTMVQPDATQGALIASYHDAEIQEDRLLTEAVTELEEGTKLTFQVNPEEGYEFDYWKINDVKSDKMSNPLNITLESDLKVEPVLKKSETPAETFAIKYDCGKHATITGTADDKPFTSGDKFAAGTKIVLTVTLEDGYEIMHWADADNNPIEGTKGLTTYSFTVEGPADVFARTKKTAAPQPTMYKITMVSPDAKQGMLMAYTVNSEGKQILIRDGMSVESGSDVTFAVVPKKGYEMDYWLVNDKRQELEGGQYPNNKTIKVTGNLKVQPVLKAKTAPQPKKFEVSYSCGAHATIAGTVNGEPFESGDKLAVGTEVVLTVTPEEGYEVKHWIDSDDEVVPGSEGKNSYTFTVDGYTSIVAKIQKKKDTPQYETVHVKVEYESINGSITTTYVAPDGSSQSISGDDDIPVGSVVTLRATIFMPNYQVVYMNNGDIVPEEALSEDGLVYTFRANEDASIQALFSKKTTPEPTDKAKVTFKVEGAGGFIFGNYKEPESEFTRSIFDGDTKDLPIGTVVTFTATLLSDAYQVTYTNNGEAVPAASLSGEGTVYKFTVKGDATVLATFSKKEVPNEDYTFTFEGGKGGTVTATVDMEPIESGAKIAAGTMIRVQATPDENYEIDEWRVNDEPVSTYGKDYYYVTLMKDTNVKVTFKSTKPVEYAVTVAPVLPSAEAGTVKLYKENGTAVESGTAVAVNTKMYVEVKPAAKYELETLQVNNTTIKAGDAALVNLTGGGFKYSFTVTEATTIKATFKLGGAVEQLTQNQIVAYVTNGGTRLEVTGATEGTEVRLYDYTGQLLLSSTEHALDISALPAGGYIVLVGNYTTRIVK